MALRGQMSLASYDRLFPSQDVLPSGGVGNLIAAPLYGKARKTGATVFLDLASLEQHEDQWAYLSTLGRMTPREVTRAVDRAARVTVGTAVNQIGGTRFDQGPAPGAYGDPRPPGCWHPAGAGRANPGAACLAQACGVDAQPAVL
jgi:hypothetical protein